jgi:predicted nucleotidyltransferase
MPDDVLALCRWPQLDGVYSTALRSAVEFALAETTPLGIIATGTVIRGHAHPASDIDLYVIHDAPYRRRVQRFFHGVPAEIFINPPHAVRAYFPSEHRDGRRLTAHMLATGFVVLDRDPVVEQLRIESREWLGRPEMFSAEDAQRARYAAASHLEDGADITFIDATAAALILGRAVTQSLEYWLRSRGRPIPRSKDLVATIAAFDLELSRLVEGFVNAESSAERLEFAHRIGDFTLGTRGFFEWDSGQDPMPESSG